MMLLSLQLTIGQSCADVVPGIVLGELVDNQVSPAYPNTVRQLRTRLENTNIIVEWRRKSEKMCYW